MASKTLVLLFISLCVLAVKGQDDYNSTDYESNDYDTAGNETDELFDWSFNWLDAYLYIWACDPNPCLNGGTCSNETADGQFVCSCTELYTGTKCQKVRNVCKDANCGQGDCLVTNTAPFFECKCKVPYQLPTCRTAAPCRPNPCLNGGSCHKGRTRASFRCDCPDQYSGKFCQVGPTDCFEEDGTSYRGSVSETEGGRECLQWNSFFILDKGADPFQEYEGFDGLGQHNYCRNPDGDARPWCFVNKKDKLKWAYCKVRRCSESAPPTQSNIHDDTDDPDPAEVAEFSQCGIAQPERGSRVFGGKKSLPGANPWQASLQMRQKGHTNESFEASCGGILIEPCWVLTAGHCVQFVDPSIDRGFPMPEMEFRVQLGGVNIKKDEEYDQNLDVEKIIVHEGYKEADEGGVSNDIALLKLKSVNGRCANETRFVRKACLPREMFPPNTECVISGWGVTETKEHGSDQLLDAPVVLISQQRCSDNNSYGNLLDDTMFCAGNVKGGVDTCQGDSGGPLVCQQAGIHYVTGVVSWGDGCGLKNKPGIYANVARFVDWIAAKMLQN